MSNTRLPVLITLLLALGALPGVNAQVAETYKARLGTVPVDATTQADISGAGSVTAVLTGTTLNVSGSFSGLLGPATFARIHVAPKGIRGPAVLGLKVVGTTSGVLQGELTLTPAQIDHLKRDRLYVQVHSERAPDGNLWGWLLP